MIGSAFGINTAFAGMTSAAQRFERSAVNTVQDTAPGAAGDLVGDVVDQIEARTAFAANAGVVRTADDMMKKLLDIRA